MKRGAAIVALVFGVAGAGAVLGACGGNGPLPVRKILVDVEPAAIGINREDVRKIVEDTLSHARGVRIVDASRGDAAVVRVRVEGFGVGADPETKSPQKTTLALSVEVSSVPGDAGEYRGHAIASAMGMIDEKTLVGQALRDALAQVLMTRNAGELKSAELVAWLGDDNASDEQKKRAIRILGSRRDRTGVDAIGKVLLSGDKELAPLALAALTNIGDPSAVDAVIAYSDRQPPVVKKQCIDAVRSMGSARARAWLFTLSTGSPDLDVQDFASAALAALEAQTVNVPTVAEKNAAPSPPTLPN